MAGTGGDRKGRTGYVAECFWPGVTEAELAAVDARAQRSAEELAREGEPVRYLGSVFFPEDEVVFFQFEAASAEAARAASERAQIPFERVVESVRVPAGRETADTRRGPR